MDLVDLYILDFLMGTYEGVIKGSGDPRAGAKIEPLTEIRASGEE